MNSKPLPLAYTNCLVYDLEKAFWDERGKGARFRMMKLGNAYFRDRLMSMIQVEEIDPIVEAVGDVLKADGVIAESACARDGRLLRVKFGGCAHLQVENEMVANGIEPMACIPANLIVMAVEEKLDCPVEVAEIKVDGGECQLTLVVFEKRSEPS